MEESATDPPGIFLILSIISALTNASQGVGQYTVGRRKFAPDLLCRESLGITAEYFLLLDNKVLLS